MFSGAANAAADQDRDDGDAKASPTRSEASASADAVSDIVTGDPGIAHTIFRSVGTVDCLGAHISAARARDVRLLGGSV